MSGHWKKIAGRMVQGLNVQPGELIDIRDGCGDPEILMETALAVERAGATPLVQLFSPKYIERLWQEVPLPFLEKWDTHRLQWMHKVDRVLVLGGARADPGSGAPGALAAWDRAQYRLGLIEEARRLPYLVAALPDTKRAEQLGLSVNVLKEILLPALEVSISELQVETARILAQVSQAREIVITTGENYRLYLEHGEREWLVDDGLIDEIDRQKGAVVSNLPAGSVYTTVLEEKTCGDLWLPQVGPARQVLLHFSGGRIRLIKAASGADLLEAELDRHSGEPRRISHIGLGLNPRLRQPAGWVIVDEHVHGAVFLALGENRYMGGLNESSLNADYLLEAASLAVDGLVVVSRGSVA